MPTFLGCTTVVGPISTYNSGLFPTKKPHLVAVVKTIQRVSCFLCLNGLALWPSSRRLCCENSQRFHLKEKLLSAAACVCVCVAHGGNMGFEVMKRRA